MDKYYTVAKLSDIYGVSKGAIKHWIMAGCPFEIEDNKIPGKRKRRILNKEEVDKWLNSSERNPIP